MILIKLKRAYEDPSQDDGYRILVDKFWPRGISKEDAEIDEWLKEIAPTDTLRNVFHESDDFSSFKTQYKEQLKTTKRKEACQKILDKAKEGGVTLVFTSKNEKENNAVVLKEFLEEMNRL